MNKPIIVTAIIAVLIALVSVCFLPKPSSVEEETPGPSPLITTDYDVLKDGRFGGGGGESTDFAAMQDLGVTGKDYLGMLLAK